MNIPTKGHQRNSKGTQAWACAEMNHQTVRMLLPFRMMMDFVSSTVWIPKAGRLRVCRLTAFLLSSWFVIEVYQSWSPWKQYIYKPKSAGERRWATSGSVSVIRSAGGLIAVDRDSLLLIVLIGSVQAQRKLLLRPSSIFQVVGLFISSLPPMIMITSRWTESVSFENLFF